MSSNRKNAVVSGRIEKFVENDGFKGTSFRNLHLVGDGSQPYTVSLNDNLEFPKPGDHIRIFGVRKENGFFLTSRWEFV